jgi:hypothetical protein
MALPLSDLSLFALLRNLRLLSGQRAAAAAAPPAGASAAASAAAAAAALPLRVWVGGAAAPATAAALRRLAGEPRLEILCDGTGGVAEPLAALAGARLAAVVVSQVFHARAPPAAWAAARAALDPEDGALGMTWFRAAAARGGAAGSAASAAPPNVSEACARVSAVLFAYRFAQ